MTGRLRVEADVVERPEGGPLVEVVLTNEGEDPLVVNGRLTVGYRDSDSRELFAGVYPRGSDEVVSRQRKRYERDLALPEHYVDLAPGERLSGSFDLLDWYSLPGEGEYDLRVFYQADEPLALERAPEGLVRGVHASPRVPFTLVHNP